MRTSNTSIRGTGKARRALPLLLVLALFGCDDFLTTAPKGQLSTPNFFTNADHAHQATNATYAMLRNWTVHTLFWVGMTDIVSDDATKGSVPNDAGYLIPMEDLEWDAGNIVLSNTWSGYYDGIYRANVAIENIPGIQMNETVRARLVGENQFLRAYYYFFMVRAFGGVPLITEVLEAGQYDQPRASVEQVYAQIEQDLLDAIPVLPEQSEYGAADMGRASKGAARALLAQAHLFQEEYEEAFDQAEAVIESGEYTLYPEYGEIFREAGENSSETVFEVQAVAVEGGVPAPQGGAVQYTQVQGVRGTPNLGWGFNTVSPDLESSYEPGDPRLQETILYPWELLPDGTGQLVHENSGMLNNRYNQKVFRPTTEPGGSGNSGVNIRRIRYSDVLLVGAEAAYHTGNEPQARTWLNMVRERARGDRTATLGFQHETLSNIIADDLLGLATDSRVFVRFADPSSDAFAAGLRSFESEVDATVEQPLPPLRVINLDIIESVNGTPVTTVAEYEAAVEAAPGTALLEITRVEQDAGGDVATSTVVATVDVDPLLPDVTAGGPALLDAIWTERRHELGMEQHRWFDIIRQGRANELMEALTCEDRALAPGCSMLQFEEGTHELYPIPLGEITITGLAQNPGYTN